MSVSIGEAIPGAVGHRRADHARRRGGSRGAVRRCQSARFAICRTRRKLEREGRPRRMVGECPDFGRRCGTSSRRFPASVVLRAVRAGSESLWPRLGLWQRALGRLAVRTAPSSLKVGISHRKLPRSRIGFRFDGRCRGGARLRARDTITRMACKNSSPTTECSCSRVRDVL